jgi:hypothetical protein
MLELSPNKLDKKSVSELLSNSVAQDQIRNMAKSYWESWFEEPIPVLDNKTPREAAKTAGGREKLEVLLIQYERSNTNDAANILKADVNYLRKELALCS